mmetsp:Transcript_122204/g.390861  ORF Transcript_122204/g.390861 Transcript_122204/m.390861 type:complete len:377 (-) Transcript_122204:22-1152(-)
MSKTCDTTTMHSKSLRLELAPPLLRGMVLSTPLKSTPSAGTLVLKTISLGLFGGGLLGNRETCGVHEAVCSLGHHDGLRGQGLAVHLREREEALPRAAVEELEFALDARSDALVHLLLRELGGHGAIRERKVPTPLVHERVHRLVVRQHGREDRAERRVDRGPDDVVPLDACLAGLGHQDTSWAQLRFAHLIELLRIKLVARTALKWIVEVHDDHIERLGRLLQHNLGVLNHELEARVRKSLRVLGQMLLAESHDIAIDVDHDALLDRLVPQHLPCGGALASTPDVDALRIGVHEHGRMHQGLVVYELVDLAGLQEAVDDQATTEGLQVHDVDVLELGSRRGQNFLDLVHAAEAILELLLHPLRHSSCNCRDLALV